MIKMNEPQKLKDGRIVKPFLYEAGKVYCFGSDGSTLIVSQEDFVIEEKKEKETITVIPKEKKEEVIVVVEEKKNEDNFFVEEPKKDEPVIEDNTKDVWKNISDEEYI